MGSRYSLSTDDDVARHVSKVYSYNHAIMYQGKNYSYVSLEASRFIYKFENVFMDILTYSQAYNVTMAMDLKMVLLTVLIGIQF